MLAPIILFVFNRPDHTRRAVEALAKNDLASVSELIIFCDGPRNEQEKSLTDEVRYFCGKIAGFRSVRIINRVENRGCTRSVISGVSEVLAEHDAAIIFEDDLLSSPHTLRYLNESLERYRNEPSVFSISAWSHPRHLMDVPASYPFSSYFIPRNGSWGWAIWSDRWKRVDWDVSDYSSFMSNAHLVSAFARSGKDLPEMLRLQVEGDLATWDILLSYSQFKHGGLTLYPVRSYTTNIGLDGSGTHCGSTSRYDNDISQAESTQNYPSHIYVDEYILASFRSAYEYKSPSIIVRIVNKLCRMLLGKNIFQV